MGLVYVAYHVQLHFQHSIQCLVQISTTLHSKVNSPWKRFLPCRWSQKGQRNTTHHTHVLWNPYDYSSLLLTSQSLLLVHTIPATEFVTASNEGKIIITDLEHCSSKIKFCPLTLEILKQLHQKQSTWKPCLHFFPTWRISVILGKI